MSEDIKMADVFDLPFSVEPSGVISDDHCIAVGEFCGTMEQSKSAVLAINNHDNLTQQVAELRAALLSVIHKSYDNNETKQAIELFARNALEENQ